MNWFLKILLPVLACVALVGLVATRGDDASQPAASPAPSAAPGDAMTSMKRDARIGYLHHSTGEVVWNGGVADAVRAHSSASGKAYAIEHLAYPATDAGLPPLIRRLAKTYPWANYPYDYWNLWVKHTGKSRDRGELNLDDLAKRFDVIVFKHCFPVSRVKPDDGNPSVSSAEKTIANYRLQYEALKHRMHEFPEKRFIVWTGAALPEARTNPDDARRARAFFEWVKGVWDEKGDNIFVWDFHELETEGGLFLREEYAKSPGDAHPSAAFGKKVAPLIAQRIVDVIEGRGDATSLTGDAREGSAAGAASSQAAR